MPVRILTTYPEEWANGGYAATYGADVRHVWIGGEVPRRPASAGSVPTFDGRGEVVTQRGFENLLDMARKFQPDVFLFTIHFGLTSEMVREVLGAAGGPTKAIMHYADQRNVVARHVVQYDGILDLLLVNNEDRADWEKYKRLPIGFDVEVLHEGVSPKEYWPMPSRRRSEVFFGGNNFKSLRDELGEGSHKGTWWIEELRQFPGIDFRDALLGAVNAGFDLVVRGSVGWGRDFRVLPTVFHPKYLAELRSAPIILGTNHLSKFRGYMRRQFRAMASGRLYMCEYIPGMELDFDNHGDLVWFRTVDEAVDLIRWYLDHDEAREAVAERGRGTILRAHTFEHRLAEFVRILERRRWT